jgi:hypothetical protein
LQTLGEQEEFLLETLTYEAPLPQQLNDEDVLQALSRLPENFRVVILLAISQRKQHAEVETLAIFDCRTPVRVKQISFVQNRFGNFFNDRIAHKSLSLGLDVFKS